MAEIQDGIGRLKSKVPIPGSRQMIKSPYLRQTCNVKSPAFAPPPPPPFSGLTLIGALKEKMKTLPLYVHVLHKPEMRSFHVVVLQRQQRNVPKCKTHVH